MTSLNSEALAKLMAEFEDKNGPVETTPVSFAAQDPSVRTFREHSYAQVQEAKSRKGAKPKKARILRAAPEPKKVILHKATTERNKRIEKMANLLGVTTAQLNEAAKEARMQLRSYTRKGEKKN